MFHLLFEKSNAFYERVFAGYGRLLARHYKLAICLSLAVNIVLSLGIMRMRVITDADELFTPIGSEGWRDELRLKQLFNKSRLTPDFYLHQLLDLGTWAEINFMPRIGGDENILQPMYIEEIARIHAHLMNNTVVWMDNGTQRVDFEHVCARRNGKCIVDGLDLLDKDFYVVWLQRTMNEKARSLKEKAKLRLDSTKNGTVKAEEEDEEDEKKTNDFRFYFQLGGGNEIRMTDLTYNLGKHFRVNANGSSPGFAPLLKLRYNLRADYKHEDAALRLWELKFVASIQAMLAADQSSSLVKLTTLSYAVSQSLELEMQANMNVDTMLIAGTFVLIMVFSSVLMSLGTDCVTSPGVALPMSGIASASFGMTSAFGLLAWCGYDACNLIGVVPFLVIGIGIDDMFIVYATFVRSYKAKRQPYEDLIADAMRHSGVSITITSLTDFVAFMVGLTTGFRGVHSFCVYAGFSILFCYLYQLTLFGGFLCMHARRIAVRRNAFVVCLPNERVVECFGSTCAAAEDDADDDDDDDEKKNNGVEKICGDVSEDENKTQWRKAVSWARGLFARLNKFMICTSYGKLAVAALFVAYLSASLWSASQIREGIDLGNLVAEDSYYKHYMNDNKRFIDLNPIVMFVVHEPVDYENAQVRLRLKKLVADAFRIDGINDRFQFNWLETYSNRRVKYKRRIEPLVDELKDYPPYLNDLIINRVTVTNGTRPGRVVTPYSLDPQRAMPDAAVSARGQVEYEIAASRFYLQYSRVELSARDAVPMHHLRKLCAESGLPVIAYSITFRFFEQFEQTLPNIVQAFVIAIEAMFCIAIVFIPDLVSVACIIASMLSIMCGLVGAMHAWSLTLSSITMIELIMSIGFCIDFSAHVTHAFVTGHGTRQQRALKANERVGVPIFNSAASTMIGIGLLAFCKSYVFVTFFKTMIILMCLGVLNSLVFLPVLLSVVGADWPMHRDRDAVVKGKVEHTSETSETEQLKAASTATAAAVDSITSN